MSTTGQDQKLQQFTQAIADYARQQSEQIRQEVAAYKAERLNRAEEDVLRESYALIQKEQDALRRTIRRERSENETAARQALFRRREEMSRELFARAETQLAAFADSADYLPFLIRSLQAVADTLPAEGTVYFLRPQDEALFEQLTAACPAAQNLRTAADIRLGGVRAENRAAGLAVDDTLESRLQQQHRWFTDHSGFTIE